MGSDLRHYADALADKISIHAPRMGSDDGRVVGPVDGVLISIHAPRMGSDFSWRGLPPTVDISIHAPRMGSDLKRSDDMTQKILFQSTLPGWGATNRRYCSVSRMANFNPRSPDGERLHLIVDLRHRFGISIHAPRMGSDRENGHLRPRYGQNHPFSTLIVSQIVVDVLGTVRKSQKHQRTSHYEVIKQPERRK